MEGKQTDSQGNDIISSSVKEKHCSRAAVEMANDGVVGLVYDARMCAHQNESNSEHPEQPERISSIYQCLKSAGIVARCVKVEAREATDEELRSVHTESHVELMKAVSSRTYGRHGRKGIAKRYNSIYFNEGSSESALLAAGSVIEVSDQVAQGKLKAGAAIVRPPGHHAEADAAMGFCLFNNVAIAAHLLVHKKKQLGVQKLLIVDWDVHHGNGTQHMFWSDPQVLYFSVHRFDDGSFYPAGDEGNYDHVGVGKGAGYNINIPWPHGQFGDADYLAVWEHVLMPVARKYNPDMVLISAGFDSAEGDPLGECRVTPTAYFKMTKQLMEIAEGRVVIALEGGYNLTSISNSYLACMHALLGDVFLENPTHLNSLLAPTLPLIEKVQNELQKYWPVLSINQKELATVDIERELLAEKEEIQLKPEVEYSVSEEMPITDIIELLAKLSTDGHVATDGTEALLDSYNQPNSPLGTQPENLDAATSSVPDLPGGKDPTNLKVGPEIIFSETGDINLLDKDSEEHTLEIEMGQTAQGSNDIIHNSSATLDYNLLEDISSKGGDEGARKAALLNMEETAKLESSKEVMCQSVDAMFPSSTTNGVDNIQDSHKFATKVGHSSEIVHTSSAVSREEQVLSTRKGTENSYVWYVCYGSNMWLPRFMCYIQGGQVEGMVDCCIGCRDPSPPLASLWLTIPNRLFFGRNYSYTWGIGGVAFIDPLPEGDVKTHVRAYKITLEQFKDIFHQENCIEGIPNQEFPIDANLIQSLKNGLPATSYTIFEDGWYGTIIYLGDQDGLPILSFTCSLDDMAKFRSGDLDVHRPSAAYEQAIVRGLIENVDLSKEQAKDYIVGARCPNPTPGM